MIRNTTLLLFLIGFGFSCSSVKPYQRQYLQDNEMQLTHHKCAQFETNVHVYREGAAGGGGGKAGGGCGCN